MTYEKLDRSLKNVMTAALLLLTKTIIGALNLYGMAAAKIIDSHLAKLIFDFDTPIMKAQIHNEMIWCLIWTKIPKNCDKNLNSKLGLINHAVTVKIWNDKQKNNNKDLYSSSLIRFRKSGYVKLNFKSFYIQSMRDNTILYTLYTYHKLG